jgi:Tfp pilus assembly protein PilP
MRALQIVTFAVLVASAATTTIVRAQQTKTPTPQAKPASPAVKTATPAPATSAAGTAKAAMPPPAAAKAPAPVAAAPVAAAPVAATPVAPPAETFTYDPGGRRDPFLNLVAAADPKNQGKRGEAGAAGMSVSEISVRGVLQSRGRLVAMVMGPDNKTYIMHQGDKLLDGSIKLITPQGLVIEQEVNDPLSVVKQREVRKLLRGLEDAK